MQRFFVEPHQIDGDRHEIHITGSDLPPRRNRPTLHLNAFRREPAITEFDWPFTPSPRSSPRFSTQVGSVLHAVLPALQPAQG